MAERSGNGFALIGSAALHGLVLLFLLLATLPCGSWERTVDRLGLPVAFNPVQCNKPVALPGVAIEATLVGPTAAPKARTHATSKPRHGAPPPASAPNKSKAPTHKVPVPTLPPPPQHPDVKDQQKVVALAKQAEQAKQAQQARERQRQSELDAERKHTDELLEQLAALKKQRQAIEHKSDLQQQRMQQLADLKKQSGTAAADTPDAAQARSGQSGVDTGLANQYGAALTNIITQNWLRPDNIPKGVVCPIQIVQIPGGQVIDVKVLPSCPFDEPGRESVKNAVLRAQPLPYKGFESVFKRIITLNFTVDK